MFLYLKFHEVFMLTENSALNYVFPDQVSKKNFYKKHAWTTYNKIILKTICKF